MTVQKRSQVVKLVKWGGTPDASAKPEARVPASGLVFTSGVYNHSSIGPSSCSLSS